MTQVPLDPLELQNQVNALDREINALIAERDELRAALAAVTAERDKLAAALRPFAVVGRQVQPTRGISPDAMWLWRRTSSGHPEAFGISLEDCQRAAQALAALEQ